MLLCLLADSITALGDEGNECEPKVQRYQIRCIRDE